MKNVYDLSRVLPMYSFPFKEIILGASKSSKSASIFYGITDRIEGYSREETTWIRALAEAEPLKGMDILLTKPTDPDRWNESWYRLGDESYWEPNSNMKYFPELQHWIASTRVFEQVGRQIVFIQMQGSNTPEHVDQEAVNAPDGTVIEPPEFLWITSAKIGKKLVVDGKIVDTNVCWFNSYTPHQTLPSDGLRWSLRIDGKFTAEFKNKLQQL